MIISLNLLKSFLLFKDNDQIFYYIVKSGLEIKNKLVISEYFNGKFNIKENNIKLYYIKQLPKFFILILKKNFFVKESEKFIILKFKVKYIFDKYKNEIIINPLDFLFKSDVILDLEFTSNLFYLKCHYNLAFYLNKIYNIEINNDLLFVDFKNNNDIVEISNLNICKNKISFFSLIHVKLKDNLIVYNSFYTVLGIKYINFIIDFCNFFEKIYGSPLHCYPKLKKIKIVDNLNIVPKNKLSDYHINLINNKNILYSLNENNEPLCILGLKGLVNSEIDKHTKEIYIEIASFNKNYIHFIEKNFNLSTSASLCFKNIDNHKDMEFILSNLLKELKEIQNIKNSNILFYNNFKKKNKKINVCSIDYDYFLKLFEINISVNEFKKIIFKIFSKDRIKIISNKIYKINIYNIFEQHIENNTDIYQEILKYINKDFNVFYNDKNININFKSIKYNNNTDYLLQKNIFLLKQKFNKLHYLDIFSDTFVQNHNLKILNPLFMNKNSLRSNILDSFIDYIIDNDINANIYNKYYEIGKVFFVKNNKIKEELHLFILFLYKNENSLFEYINDLLIIFDDLKLLKIDILKNNFNFQIKTFLNTKNSFRNRKYYCLEVSLNNDLFINKEKNNIIDLKKYYLDRTFSINSNDIRKFYINLISYFKFYKLIDIFNIKLNIYNITLRFFYNTIKERKDIENFLK